jgi:hypothetical protein
MEVDLMPENHPVYLYAQDCNDFSTTGLVGDIRPLEATFTEEKNGEAQVVMRLPYDEYERWKAAKVGNYIKCEVPVRVPPVIRNDEFADTVPVGKISG